MIQHHRTKTRTTLKKKDLDNIREQRLEQHERIKANITLENKDPDNIK